MHHLHQLKTCRKKCSSVPKKKKKPLSHRWMNSQSVTQRRRSKLTHRTVHNRNHLPRRSQTHKRPSLHKKSPGQRTPLRFSLTSLYWLKKSPGPLPRPHCRRRRGDRLAGRVSSTSHRPLNSTAENSDHPSVRSGPQRLSCNPRGKNQLPRLTSKRWAEWKSCLLRKPEEKETTQRSGRTLPQEQVGFRWIELVRCDDLF